MSKKPIPMGIGKPTLQSAPVADVSADAVANIQKLADSQRPSVSPEPQSEPEPKPKRSKLRPRGNVPLTDEDLELVKKACEVLGELSFGSAPVPQTALYTQAVRWYAEYVTTHCELPMKIKK